MLVSGSSVHASMKTEFAFGLLKCLMRFKRPDLVSCLFYYYTITIKLSKSLVHLFLRFTFIQEVKKSDRSLEIDTWHATYCSFCLGALKGLLNL